MNIYKGKIPLYHFDLYRICAADLYGIGYEEFFYGNGITAVEWSERLGELLPRDHWHVTLKHGGDDRRVIGIAVRGQQFKQRFAEVKL
jgi:tRNA threonylcarbamoyladenosine biosynthesis protein TsaE